MPKNGDSAFLLARSLFESNLWNGDPHLLKLWIYFLGKAQFKKNSPECGMLGTSVRQIREDNAYGTYLAKKRWSHKKILRMLKILEDQKRIEVERTVKGTLVKIVKYKEYQDFSRYKRTEKAPPGEHQENTRRTLTPKKNSNNEPSKAPNNVNNVNNVNNTTTVPNHKKLVLDKKQLLSINFLDEEWKNITLKDKDRWSKAYPACDIEIELAQMAEWLLSNPEKKKKKYRRFITNWLARSQERGGTKKKKIESTPPYFKEF